MAWNRPILTDSGGFQVVSLGELRKIDDGGVTFQSHLDGSYHRFTPELSIEVQEALGSDIAVAFDQPVPPASTALTALAEATARSNVLGGRSLEATPVPTRRSSHHPGRPRSELRAESTRVVAGLPFDGICIGGLAGDETPLSARPRSDVVVELLEAAADPRPRYLMGLGSPVDLLEAVHRGIDIFDSVLPARVARNGQLWVPGGRLNMRNAQFVDDQRPVQEAAAARSAATSRGRIWRTFSAPRSSSPTPRDLSQPDLHPRLHGRKSAPTRSGTFAAGLPELRATGHAVTV